MAINYSSSEFSGNFFGNPGAVCEVISYSICIFICLEVHMKVKVFGFPMCISWGFLENEFIIQRMCVFIVHFSAVGDFVKMDEIVGEIETDKVCVMCFPF